MTTQTQFTDYTQAAEFLKENEAEALHSVKNGTGLDTVFKLGDGSLWAEHDKAGDPYTLIQLEDVNHGR